jgi:hypothetical protein
MSAYNPPDNFTPIFNSSEYLVSTQSLTIATGDARYLKLTGGIVGGLTTFNAGVNSAGVVSITNTTQSTNTSTGALVVSGGLGIAKNCHFGGTLHLQNGSIATPTLAFVSAPSTGLSRDSIGGDILFNVGGLQCFSVGTTYINSSTPHVFKGLGASATDPAITFGSSYTTGLYTPAINQLAITTNGVQRLLFDNTTITAQQPITVPLGSVSNCSIQFTSDPNTGIYSSSADNLNFATSGASRLAITSSGFVNITNNLTIANGTAASPSLSFQGTSTNTGFYLPSTDTIGFSADGTLRMDLNTTRLAMAVPITLPTTGGTASNLDFYERLQHSSAWTYGDKTIPATTIICVRIGSLITITIPDSGPYTNTSGSAARITLNVIIPSRFAPTSNLNPVGLINVAGTTTLVRFGLLTTGVIEITQTTGANFASGTLLQIYANSFSYTI